MATQTIIYKPRHARSEFTEHLIEKRDELLCDHLPRRCMIRSFGLLLAGLCIPVLMLLGWLPTTFLLGFIGLALTATGGVCAFIFCGEV